MLPIRTSIEKNRASVQKIGTCIQKIQATMAKILASILLFQARLPFIKPNMLLFKETNSLNQSTKAQIKTKTKALNPSV